MICVVDQNRVNHSQAYDICSGFGYKLMVFETEFTQKQIFNALLHWWSKPKEISLWVDGIKNLTDGNWYYHSYMKTPVSNDLLWIGGAASATGCLVAASSDEPFKVAGHNCSSMHYPICELRNTTSTAASIRKRSEFFITYTRGVKS